MVENLTIARPYAKAIFDLAKNDNLLEEWEKLLEFLSKIISNDKVFYFINDKTLSHIYKSNNLNFIIESSGLFSEDLKKKYVNLINLLAINGRLNCIKEILDLYKYRMNIELNRINAFIETADSISNIQKEVIIDILSKKYNKNVLAFFEINEKLLGGFIIKIDDFVLDSSILGNLFLLRTKILA